MWKVLGEDAIYLDIPYKMKDGLIRLSGEGEKADAFRKMLDMSEVTFMINGETEENTFFINVPEELTPEDIQLMADVVLDIAKGLDFPFISADEAEQRYQVIITNNKEPELIGLNKTPGMSSGEIFKPIFRSLDAPGRRNTEFDKF